jgi:hypothetical protein
MNGQPLKVTLSGTAYQRGQRWWWRVQLPGEDKPKARALKPEGQKAATKDRQEAAKVAFELWEHAVREDERRRVRMDADEKIARLKAKFLQKMHDVSQVVNRLSNREDAEARKGVDEDVQTAEPSCDTEETGTCGCCKAHDVPMTELRAIDSGQLLCPKCLANLKAAASTIEPQETKHTVPEADQALVL